MKQFPIAIQLYSVREDMAADFKGTLKKVKEMGYDGVEFAGLFGHTAADVKKMCEEIGLVPISAHIALKEFLEDPAIFETYSAIGCRYAVIPYLTEEYRPGQPKFLELIDIAKDLGKKANAIGMTLCYHNHDFEFAKIDGEYALDVLYREVPADLLQTEIDTCWANVGGVNPADYVRKYSGRAEIVHLKDFVGKKSENMYALIGIDENEKKDTGGAFEFRPVGSGCQDFPAILAAAEDAGAQWVVVEQDMPSLGKTPMECAQMSINYLRSLY